MVGLFHINSAAFTFLELLSGHQKCPNFPPGSPPLDPLSPKHTKQNYGPVVTVLAAINILVVIVTK